MLLILLLFNISLLFITYFLTGKDIFAPPCIICETFIVSIFFSLYNWERWELWAYSVDSTCYLFIGIISYVLGCLLSYTLLNRKKTRCGLTNRIIESKNTFYVIPVKTSTVVFLIVFECAICFLYYNNIRSVALSFGSNSSLTSVLYSYNTLLTNNMLEIEAGGSFIVRQAVKFSFVIGLLAIAVLINNILVEGFKHRHLLLIGIIIPSIILSILGSARINIFKYITFFITVFNMTYHRKYGWHRYIRPKIIFKIIIAFAAILIAFTALRNLLGRGLRFDPLYYISVYVGGSIKLFDMFIVSGRTSNNYIGQETFYGLLSVLHRFSIVGDPYKRLEFRDYNGYFVGNVYTAFRRYYNDFGTTGLLIVSFLLGFVIMTFYIRCKTGGKMLSLLDLRLLIFGVLSWGMYLISIDEYILSTVISILYITYIIIIIFLWFFINNLRISRQKIILRKKRKSIF